jgi:hypothetical protein
MLTGGPGPSVAGSNLRAAIDGMLVPPVSAAQAKPMPSSSNDLQAAQTNRACVPPVSSVAAELLVSSTSRASPRLKTQAQPWTPPRNGFHARRGDRARMQQSSSKSHGLSIPAACTTQGQSLSPQTNGFRTAQTKRAEIPRASSESSDLLDTSTPTIQASLLPAGNKVETAHESHTQMPQSVFKSHELLVSRAVTNQDINGLHPNKGFQEVGDNGTKTPQPSPGPGSSRIYHESPDDVAAKHAYLLERYLEKFKRLKGKGDTSLESSLLEVYAGAVRIRQSEINRSNQIRLDKLIVELGVLHMEGYYRGQG